ncbi:MAG: PAS domain-containing protein [Dehalococcoidia bacterium]|nr:PAS domain-containing protein [Dehalococcoidia bacterium]
MTGDPGAEALLDAVFDAIPSMVFVQRASDLTYVRANAAGQQFHGLSEAELTGKTVFDLFPPEGATRLHELQTEAASNNRSVRVAEEVVVTQDGLHYLSGQIVPLEGAGGQPGLLLTVIRDVTEQRGLRATSVAWSDIIENAEWGVAVLSSDGLRLERVSPGFARMHRFTVDELAGRPREDIVAPESREELHRMLDVVLERGHHSFECVHLRKDRTTFPALVVGSAVGGTDGSPRYRHISIQDISSLKETQAQLHAARVEAQRANQAKSEFLSRMSHELRTPLNVILGFAQVLQLDELSPGQSESVGHILQAGRHLLALIDDVLDISRIESGKMALSIEPVAMGDAVEDVLKLMQPLADERGVTLTHPSRGCGCHAFADRQRLKQVLLNLVTNAIKYNTRGGSLVIECADDGARVHISFIDDGIGFPEDALGRLFVPFDRLGREATEVEGTGLGLSLCKGLVEAMGGTIDARARPGGGSIFTVQLNRADAPALTGHVDGGHAAAGRASRGVVLYVEDNLANFKLIEQVLSRRPGISVIPAMQGSLGLQLARDHHPDLVLLDLHLPDMKGDEVLQRLLRDPMTASIPVVIASADATQRQVERLLRMGARAYLTKPIDVPRLLETVDELLGD